MPGQWQGSNRRAELPPDWDSAIRPRILARDGQQCALVEDGVRCTQRATDVDHIGDKNDHRDENLRAICGWHHKKRSSQQGNAARKRVSEKRRPEPHPGLITKGR
jgi:5-methylcytosine-specific restriction protein A